MKGELTIRHLIIIIILLMSFWSKNMAYAENGCLVNYREKQRDKAIALLKEMFNDPGGGRFANGHKYPFVLQNPSYNL